MRLLQLAAWSAAFSWAAAAFAADAPKITFNGADYAFAFANSKELFTLNEYVTGGETVDNWTKLLSVGYWPQAQTPIQMINLIVKVAQPTLVGQPQLIARPGDASEQDIVCVIVQRDDMHRGFEIDVQRYVKEPASPGIKWYQFSKRVPRSPAPATADEIAGWVDAIWKINQPVYDHVPSAGNTTASPASGNSTALPSAAGK